MRLNKKGISPLIASVLLIAFTITLFLIISSWVQRSIVEPGLEQGGEKVADTLNCLSAKVNIIEACAQTDNKKIRVKVDNEGDVNLVGIQIRVVGATGVASIPLDFVSSPVPPLGRYDSAVQPTGDLAVGAISSIEVYPQLESGLCQSNLASKKPTAKASC